MSSTSMRPTPGKQGRVIPIVVGGLFWNLMTSLTHVTLTEHTVKLWKSRPVNNLKCVSIDASHRIPAERCRTNRKKKNQL